MSASANRNAPPPALRRNARAIFRRTDPVRADQLAQRAAEAYGRALPSGKRSAAALGVSDTTVSDMRRKGAGPLRSLNLQIVALSTDPTAHPEALVVECGVTYQRSLMPLSDEQLIARFWEYTREEARVEGALNDAQQMYSVTGDRRALITAAKAVAANATAIAAVLEEIDSRPDCPDPRTWGRA